LAPQLVIEPSSFGSTERHRTPLISRTHGTSHQQEKRYRRNGNPTCRISLAFRLVWLSVPALQGRPVAETSLASASTRRRPRLHHVLERRRSLGQAYKSRKLPASLLQLERQPDVPCFAVVAGALKRRKFGPQSSEFALECFWVHCDPSSRSASLGALRGESRRRLPAVTTTGLGAAYLRVPRLARATLPPNMGAIEVEPVRQQELQGR